MWGHTYIRAGGGMGWGVQDLQNAAPQRAASLGLYRILSDQLCVEATHSDSQCSRPVMLVVVNLRGHSLLPGLSPMLLSFPFSIQGN